MGNLLCGVFNLFTLKTMSLCDAGLSCTFCVSR